MKSKIIKLILCSIAALFIGTASIAPTIVYAEDVCNTSAPEEVKKAAGCSGSGPTLPTVITNILNAIILVAGLVAVVFIIIGGINYMTSSGDPGKTKKAKDTILYALIGLIICALAFAIVNWAISAISAAS